jgi:putative transposase
MPSQEAYPSSLTAAEWKLIEPLVPGPKFFGRPPRYSKRAILDAIFYVVRGGIAWRLLPHDLPPWRIVYYYFLFWRRAGLWQQIHDTLRDQVRLRSGKKKPRPLRSSTRRALKWLTTEECAVTMQARRFWDASDTSWWTRWG